MKSIVKVFLIVTFISTFASNTYSELDAGLAQIQARLKEIVLEIKGLNQKKYAELFSPNAFEKFKRKVKHVEELIASGDRLSRIQKTMEQAINLFTAIKKNVSLGRSTFPDIESRHCLGFSVS